MKAALATNIAAYVAFDGSAGDNGNSYAGTGGVKIVW